jgi:hypothetical protein
MKTTTTILAFFITLFSISTGCQKPTSNDPDRFLIDSPLAKAVEENDTIIWTPRAPQLDSVVGCERVDGKTRYYSYFFIDFSTPSPDEGFPEDSTWNLSFTMKVNLPGSLCQDTIPMSDVAESSVGDALPIVTSASRSREHENSVTIEIDVEVTLPIVQDGVSFGGGLAIIVETIDPYSSVLPKLITTSDWEGEVGDVTFDLVAKEAEGIAAPDPVVNPSKPACSICLPPPAVAAK